MADIYVDCAGSNCPTAGNGRSQICSMCGEVIPTNYLGLCIPHTRRDILAMLDRGDYG